ncbi:MAG: helix-turn-helix domain-containing protein [Clostridiales bacterium]|nr:helix-turn-helix domain-containing protein [Clostridiales bacterium]
MRAEAKRLSFTIEGKIPEKQYSEDTLAGRVNKLRAEKKMTQKELAEKCNTSSSTISNLLKGQVTRSHSATILAISKALGCDVDYLTEVDKLKESTQDEK